MDNIIGEFRNIGEMSLLSGRPRQRGAKEGKGERLMVCEKGKHAGFKDKTELAN